jgi:hypothetical protein
MAKRADLAGQRFGKLTVIDYSHTGVNNNAIWNCVCDCGNTTQVPTGKLNAGITKSCGCYRREASTTHGHTYEPEYYVWTSMRQRCTNPKNNRYPAYGGRGITYDPRWDDYQNFISDVGRRPSPQHSLDRVDNNKGYQPDNCRWATSKAQAANKRTVHQMQQRIDELEAELATLRGTA